MTVFMKNHEKHDFWPIFVFFDVFWSFLVHFDQFWIVFWGHQSFISLFLSTLKCTVLAKNGLFFMKKHKKHEKSTFLIKRKIYIGNLWVILSFFAKSSKTLIFMNFAVFWLFEVLRFPDHDTLFFSYKKHVI